MLKTVLSSIAVIDLLAAMLVRYGGGDWTWLAYLSLFTLLLSIQERTSNAQPE